jgi:uncharacterized protein (TIGR03437 family)
MRHILLAAICWLAPSQRLLDAQAPVPVASGLVNGASFADAASGNGSLAPGSIAALFGNDLAAAAVSFTNVPLPVSLGDVTQVTLGSIAAPLFFVSGTQINLQIPFEAAPSNVTFSVSRGSQTSIPRTVTIVPASPGIFTVGQAGQGAIVNARSVLVDHKAPAIPGETVQVFCTGLGATTPAVATGAAAPSAPMATANLPVTATIGGLPAKVTFAGLAPGFVSLYQVNIQIPADVAAGDSVPLVLRQNGVSSNTVTLAVGASLAGATTELAFSTPTTIQSPGMTAGGEPTLQIGRDSTMWVTDLAPGQIWKSTDHGATWSPIPRPIATAAGDMDGAQDGAGRLHILDQASTKCIFYYRSVDGGRSFDSVQVTSGGGVWLPSDGTCPAPGNSIDRPWVIPWGDNTVYIVHKESSSISASISVSRDGGQTFTHTAIGSNSLPQQQGAAVDPADGTLYLVAGALETPLDNNIGRNPVHSMWAAASPDGSSVSTSVIFSSQQFDLGDSEFPSIAVDDAHNVYAAWSDNSAGTVDVYINISRDRGKTWGAPIRVSHDLSVSTYPTIVAGDAGRLAVAWYGTPDPARSRGDAHGASWYVYAAVTTNALDADPVFESVKITDKPFHHDSICAHLVRCDGADTSTSDPPGYEKGIFDFFRIAADPTGALNLVWPDTTGDLPQTHFARQTGGPLLKETAAAQ